MVDIEELMNKALSNACRTDLGKKQAEKQRRIAAVLHALKLDMVEAGQDTSALDQLRRSATPDMIYPSHLPISHRTRRH